MDKQQFDQLNDGSHTRIPVWRTVLADLDTPLSVYLKLADGQDSFLFESVEGGETWGRYSIIGLPCRRRYTINGHRLACFDYGREVSAEELDDPLTAVEAIRAEYRVPDLDELPVFTGGLVGYFGYETVELIEPRLAKGGKRDEIGTDDIVLLLAEEVAVFDALEGRLWLIVNADPSEDGAFERAQRRLDQLEHRLRSGSTGYGLAVDGQAVGEPDFHYGFEKADFLDAVRRSQEYILAGDIFQVVLSQRMSVPFRARPIDVYRSLRALNPSPYMYFIDLGDTQIVGSSPEVLVRVQDRRMTVRPIAGTRPRGATAADDRALAAELMEDPKELAEHLMLVDLGRNDVGRVAATGTVQVTENMVIERYSHVMHIVSQVEGDLADDMTAMDAIRAAFPAGTLSGAPKIRAMEIIAELEPVKRNIYAGAVGYISWHDDTDLAIAIRTAVIRDGQLHVQAGAGIVADSDPEAEWQECMNKGRALITAVDRASRGL
ncbi:anthranilate synthase component I [Marinihelvus fidelis]|uniref:Anthranilate synthase component 1 n=1 Tax=Marinihelvus fidelis TaxID=2613842 RepID=A0A5N0T8L2_9GAMM|nr:anthranilate synthase component I [Marinihelvus fidelis]KAA9130824.1 anthranilate synthase component I [Marinihelvus fidelis]